MALSIRKARKPRNVVNTRRLMGKAVLPAVSTTLHGQNGRIEDILEIMGIGSINPGIFDHRHAYVR